MKSWTVHSGVGGCGESSFDEPRAYDLKVAGSRLRGGTVAVRAGIRLHEVELISDVDHKFPVHFARDSVWLGYVRRGEQTFLLPDLGWKTVREGEWFVTRIEEMMVMAARDGGVELMAFSLGPDLMASLVSMCDSVAAEQLRCFACANQQTPSMIQGAGNKRLEWLSGRIGIARCETLAGRLELEARCLDWLNELFIQPALALVSPAELGCSDHDVAALRGIACYLEQNLDADHSLADLCRRFYINEFKLKRNFKAMFGITVFGHLREARFSRAEELLKEGGLSVIEIANEVGYSNPSHFARGFDERFGASPKAFQRMHQHKPIQMNPNQPTRKV